MPYKNPKLFLFMNTFSKVEVVSFTNITRTIISFQEYFLKKFQTYFLSIISRNPKSSLSCSFLFTILEKLELLFC